MKRLEFNNEIIDGQSTVADNLAKSNRNFMLLKEILGSGASSQDIQNMLETISQTYVKTEDIVNNLSSSDTNKPVSALQAKNLKQDITNLTGQLQQLNQSVSSLTQSLNQNISNLTQQLNQNVSSLTQRLDNKADKNTIGLERISDALTVDKSGLFWCAESQNTPEPHGLLIVGVPWTNDLNFKSLVFISCNNGKMYTRFKFLGGWSPNWIEK